MWLTMRVLVYTLHWKCGTSIKSVGLTLRNTTRKDQLSWNDWVQKYMLGTNI